MSPFIEFEGKTVDRAVISACETLNIPRDKLKHEVICFGATGIFGLVGFKKARIRVAAPGIPEIESRAASEKGPLPAAEEFINADSLKSSPSASEDSAELGRQALQRLVDAVTCGAEIAVNCDNRQVVYTISGGDPALLVGKRGQTIEALRYLLKKIVNKSSEARNRVIIDIAGHVLKRQENLEALAVRLAEKACLNGKCITIGRFNPQDRKIIHLALKNDRRVKTQSKGDGYIKKLVVVPRGE